MGCKAGQPQTDTRAHTCVCVRSNGACARVACQCQPGHKDAHARARVRTRALAHNGLAFLSGTQK
eukprot:13038445-Heterocapsa_arctica.AAC.1